MADRLESKNNEIKFWKEIRDRRSWKLQAGNPGNQIDMFDSLDREQGKAKLEVTGSKNADAE